MPLPAWLVSFELIAFTTTTTGSVTAAGAVYSPPGEMEPMFGFSSQSTLVTLWPAHVAENCWVPPGCKLICPGATTSGGTIAPIARRSPFSSADVKLTACFAGKSRYPDLDILEE